MYSAFPPNKMSVPRPAMLVEIVTRPFRPACATTSASRSTNSGLALSSWWAMPSLERASERSSERSTEVVLMVGGGVGGERRKYGVR